MIGASRESFAAQRSALDDRRREPGFDALAGELLAVADLLGRQTSLRNALADSGQPEQVRRATVDQLFSSRLSPLGVAVVGDLATARWSSAADLVDACERLGAQAALTVAESDGTLDRVEDELFRFGRAVEGSAELQLALTDPSRPAAGKTALVRDLLGGKVAPVTGQLLEYVGGHLRGRRADDAVADLVALAAEQRRRAVAYVTVATPLDAAQADRLAAALSTIKGRPVKVNVELDPAVVGGVVVRVGDEIVDGSMAARLEAARRVLTEAP